jgi:hypothetical protein
VRNYISVYQFRNLFNCLVIFTRFNDDKNNIFCSVYAFATARKRFRTGFQKAVIIKFVGY